MAKHTIIVRYGELALKRGGTRKKFEGALISHIKAALTGIKFGMETERGRIFVETSETKKAVEKLTTVFGIVSVSPAEKISFKNLKNIVDGCLRKTDVKTWKGVKSFAIRARRAGNHSFTSQDVARELGAAIVKKFRTKVDLETPEKEIFVEVRQKFAYFYHEQSAGPGGLPFGTGGRVVCLISGGIDSPVAAWLMMKRGCTPIFLHANTDKNDGRAIKTIKTLRDWSPIPFQVYVVPHGEFLDECLKTAPRELVCLLCKRAMHKYASEIARKTGALGVVTGDSLGQVASQTLKNLFVETDADKFPVYRPLIGMDKVEIEKIAKKIGTFETSISPAAPCSAVAEHPETSADLEKVKEEEGFLEADKLIEQIIAKIEKIKI